MYESTPSLWRSATTSSPRYPKLTAPVHVDVAIVGGGISGITAALLLKQQGKRVAVLEKSRIADGESGVSTAHITEAIDARYHALKRTFGADGARLAGEASRAAMELIEQLIAQHQLDCGFRRTPGWLYTEKRSRVSELKSEAASAAEVGVAAVFSAEVPLPFPVRGGVRFEHQAQMNPLAYVEGLAAHVAGDGSYIFEETHVIGVIDGAPCTVETSDGTLTADAVFVAANVPVNDLVSMHTKIAAYRSYAIAAPVTGSHPDGLFWDTAEPYHYTRWQETPQGTFIIVGGADHKVGQEEHTDTAYNELLAFAAEHFGPIDPQYRWSGQIVESIDGLPYIGLNPGSKHVYIATGFAGQGITFGTASAMIVRDLITFGESRWAELFSPSRMKLDSAREFVAENVDFPRHLVLDRLTSHDVETDRPFDVKSGEGKIVMNDGRKVAVARDTAGALHALSPVCTHLGCDVAWNSAETSWDCPCHGSRFSIEGDVLNGPAVQPLAKVELKEST
jgi:glycine/D-amino acid oxidase-like deaminating enzyme/nitrite reductase/ring-hydroxylating ferredoxin subunit